MIDNKDAGMFFCADDFGLNKITNEHIIQLIKKNKIQRVSVMVSKGRELFFLDELKKSGVKIDLHLTLDEKIGSITKNRNVLIRIFSFLKRLLEIKKIKKRWRIQIELFKKIFGHNPDGLNSHEHVHFFPSVFLTLIKLAKSNKIEYIRLGKGIIGKRTVVLVLRILSQVDWILFKKIKIRTSDYLSCLDWVNLNNEFIEKYKNKNMEIVCHPGKNKDFEKMKNI